LLGGGGGGGAQGWRSSRYARSCWVAEQISPLMPDIISDSTQTGFDAPHEMFSCRLLLLLLAARKRPFRAGASSWSESSTRNMQVRQGALDLAQMPLDPWQHVFIIQQVKAPSSMGIIR
jgi:hypothetical protein